MTIPQIGYKEKTKDGFNPSTFQQDIFDYVNSNIGSGNHLIVEAVAGSGKCLGIGTKVLMYDGSIKKVEDIKIDDKLMGYDSFPRKVLSTVKGKGNLLKVIPTKGESWICNDSHIMTLAGTNRFNGKIIDVSIKDFFVKNIKTEQWKLFRSSEIYFYNTPALNFAPYLIGLWLGDGNLDGQAITNEDTEVIDYLHFWAENHDYFITDKPSKNNIKVRHISLTREHAIDQKGRFKYGSNPLRNFILSNFISSDKQKCISREYLTSTINNRLELLAGLLDTDGYYHSGYYEITTEYSKLKDDILFLSRSLGFATYATIKKIKLIGWAKFRKYWRITISGNIDSIPCKIKRKQAQKRKQIKRTNVTGWKLKSIGVGDYYGFELDGDGRFLLDDFTVTHNSTTGVQMFNRIPSDLDAVFVAFNKHIADELKLKLPDGANARTYHSLGLATLNKTFGKVEVSMDKVEIFLKRKYFSQKWMFGAVKRLVGLCKGSGDLTFSTGDLERIAFDHDIDLFEQKGEDIKYEIFNMVQNALQYSLDNPKQVDFDDMIWLPNVLDTVAFFQHDFLFVDEVQDTNLAQLFLAKHSINPDGMIVGVGDRRQSIYRFRGASDTAMDILKEDLDATELPLSISYRCPKAIHKLVHEKFPDIKFEIPEWAIDGIVRDIKPEDLNKEVLPDDMVLCRVNADLVSTCFSLIRQGTKATIRGRDIGKGLSTLIKRSCTTDVSDLLEWMQRWKESEVEKAIRIGADNKLSFINDKFETMYALTEGAKTTADVALRCETMFSDDKTGVTLSSIHRSKGLEANKVYILRPDLLPHPAAKSQADIVQEDNIRYVAYTRSKNELIFVH
jgi:hypothetical protein